MSEGTKDWPCQTPRAELVQKALEHYDEISNQACHWNGLVPTAIKAWGELKEGETVAGLREEIVALKTQLQGAGVARAELWAKLHKAEKEAKDANQARVEIGSVLTDVLAAWYRGDGANPKETPEWLVAQQVLNAGGFLKTVSILYRVLQLATALRVYANKSMWVKYQRDGEETHSLFIANEAGLEDGVLCDGWLVAEAALKESEGE